MSRKDDLRDREYRAVYAEDFLDSAIATQIKVLREERGLTQGKLAELSGMKQSRISTMEDVNYSKWSINTLKRLARAFDLPLFVYWGTFGQLLEQMDRFSREHLSRPSFNDDPAFAINVPSSTENEAEQRLPFDVARHATVVINAVDRFGLSRKNDAA